MESMEHEYERQTVVDNVSLLRPELLVKINSWWFPGIRWPEKKPGETLRGRCDSFCVETHVHYPTDVNLLADAIHGQDRAKLAEDWTAGGRTSTPKASRNGSTGCAPPDSGTNRPERVVEYVEECQKYLERAEL